MSSDREGASGQSPQGPGLTSEQLKAKLSLYVGSLPSTVIEDLFQTLKPMSLSEQKVDEIIERTIKSYSGQESNAKMDELFDKMNNLEDTLIRALKSIETRQEQRGVPEPTAELPPQPRQVVSQREPPPASEPEPDNYEPPARKQKIQFDIDDDEPPLLSGELRSPGPGYRVLLPDIPDSAIANAILLKWVEFLLETVGHQNLPEVLDYYVDIGWISEKVTMKLLAYASGMVAPRGRAKEKLSTKDHLRSLLFIEKLRGRDFDQSKLTRLEREIEYTIEKRIRSD